MRQGTFFDLKGSFFEECIRDGPVGWFIFMGYVVAVLLLLPVVLIKWAKKGFRREEV